MITLTENDLLAIISKDELDGLARELIQPGQPDPVEAAISDSLATVRIYTDPFRMSDDALRKVWRILAVCAIYNRLGTLPEKREKEQGWAIELLKEIRDGKFKNLDVDETIEPTSAQGAWGSNKRFNPR